MHCTALRALPLPAFPPLLLLLHFLYLLHTYITMLLCLIFMHYFVCMPFWRHCILFLPRLLQVPAPGRWGTGLVLYTPPTYLLPQNKKKKKILGRKKDRKRRSLLSWDLFPLSLVSPSPSLLHAGLLLRAGEHLPPPSPPHRETKRRTMRLLIGWWYFILFQVNFQISISHFVYIFIAIFALPCLHAGEVTRCLARAHATRTRVSIRRIPTYLPPGQVPATTTSQFGGMHLCLGTHCLLQNTAWHLALHCTQSDFFFLQFTLPPPPDHFARGRASEWNILHFLHFLGGGRCFSVQFIVVLFHIFFVFAPHL